MYFILLQCLCIFTLLINKGEVDTININVSHVACCCIMMLGVGGVGDDVGWCMKL